MTLLMSTFINTRQKEYGDPYQEKWVVRWREMDGIW
jgi:hypothetical protein